MEHKQLAVDVSASATRVYCSTGDGLSVRLAYSSATEEQPAAELLPSSQHWTSIDITTDQSEDDNFVRVLPGRNVRKFQSKEIKLLEQIGEGGQGTIYTAQICRLDKATNEYEPDDNVFVDNFFVAKVFKGRKSGQWPEGVFGAHVSSQYICQFYGYCIDEDSLCLLMVHYDCSLRDILDQQMEESYNGRIFPDVSALLMIIHIALSMRFLHENNIIPRDLKADNIFVDRNSHTGLPVAAYIGDFDVAPNVVGTLFWRAPEVLQVLQDGKCPFFTPKADVYSYAMTCYEILTGGIPFEGVRAMDNDVILSGKRPKLPSDLNPKMKDLIMACWHQNPEARPTFDEIVVKLKVLH